MGELADKLKRYFRFNNDEVVSVLFASFILGFVFVFRDFSFLNLVFGFVIVLASLVFHVAAQKTFALSQGYYVEFRLWWSGLLVSLMFAFLTNGRIWWIMLPGGVIFSMIAKQRIGKFRYGLNYFPMGWVAFFGPLGSIVFGSIFKNIELYLIGNAIPWMSSIFVLNLVLAVNTMLPIPPLDGHYMFFASRPWFVILFGTIFTYSILVAFDVYSWILAIIAGLIIWLVYYLSYEKEAWPVG